MNAYYIGIFHDFKIFMTETVRGERGREEEQGRGVGRKGDLGFAGLRVDGKVPSRELALVLSPLAGAAGTWS